MNGIRLVISKSLGPIYNFGTSNEIKIGLNNKIDLVPHRLSNLHYQRIPPLVATTTRVLKHRVYSSSAGKVDVTDSGYEVVEVSRSVVPNVLFGVSIISMVFGMAFGIAIGTLKWNACYYIYLTVVAVFVLGKIMDGGAVLLEKYFSVGDIIQVGHLKGEVMEKGLITTSLLIAENRRIKVPTSWFRNQDIENISQGFKRGQRSRLYDKDVMNLSHVSRGATVAKIGIQVDEIGKIPEITEEVINMMKSNSNVCLEKEQPYCYLSREKDENQSVELTLGFNLIKMNEDDLILVKKNVLLQSTQIIEKHGATIASMIVNMCR